MGEQMGGAAPAEPGTAGPAVGVGGDATQTRGPAGQTLLYLGLVLVGLVVVAASRTLWRGSGPAAAAARGLRDGDASKRLASIGDLQRFGPEEPGVALAALRGTLQDGEARVRAAGAMAMVMVVRAAAHRGDVQSEARRTVTALLETLRDPAAEPRSAAIQALGMIVTVWDGPAGVVDSSRVGNAFIEAAADPDPAVRAAAMRGLGAVGPRIAGDPPPVILAALADPSEKVRMAAADALPFFVKGLPRSLPSLVHSFEAAPPEARPAYALVVERIRPRAYGTDAVAALGSALASPDKEVRCLAASALRAFEEAAHPAIPALISSIARPGRESQPTPAPAGRANPMLTPDEHRWWVQAEGSAERNDPAHTAALTLLRILPVWPYFKGAPPIDPKSLATLAEVLKSGTPEVRAAVAYALGRFEPSAGIVSVLGETVRDPDATVRMAALKGLHDLGERMPFAPPDTVKTALEEESAGVRLWAAGALGHIRAGLDPYIPALLRHAENDPDGDVRAVCASGIRDFVRPAALTPASIPVLIKALDSPSPDASRAACELLGRIGPSAAPAVPRLRELAKGADPTLKESAQEALTKLGAERER
jgi:HEAT repeat protein